MGAALKQRPRMPDEKLDELVIAARTVPEAREMVVLECMGLIAATARRVRNTLGEDAFGEASVALLEAIDSFEREQGHFRTWAVYLMTCRVADKARTEKRFRSRVMKGEEVLEVARLDPMPELLTKALAGGKLTERQASIVHMKAHGFERQAIMDAFAFGQRTYEREIRSALEALRSYL